MVDLPSPAPAEMHRARVPPASQALTGVKSHAVAADCCCRRRMSALQLRGSSISCSLSRSSKRSADAWVLSTWAKREGDPCQRCQGYWKFYQ